MTARKGNGAGMVPGCEMGLVEHFHSPGSSRSKLGPPKGDPVLIKAIGEHIERHIGPIHLVYHEIVSSRVHVEVHHVAATREHPVEILVMSGMSERPMTMPKGCSLSPFAEVFAILPAGWPLVGKSLEDDRNYWPIRMLKQLAHHPHKYKTWLGPGHSLNDGEGPDTPFAPNTQLSAVILLESNSLPTEFLVLKGPRGREINFLVAVPLYWGAPTQAPRRYGRSAPCLRPVRHHRPHRSRALPSTADLVPIGLGIDLRCASGVSTHVLTGPAGSKGPSDRWNRG